MGQAVVDLPDPLENQNLAQTASTDDLLAQLAGDEIDRLLAESDKLPPPQPAAQSVPAEPLAAAPTPAEPAPVDFSAVLSQVTTTDSSTAPAAAPVNHEITGARESTERDMLASTDFAELDSPTTHQPRQLPLFLRPLQWISAPLVGCDEPVREAIGKIAIVTLINAISVLAYVWSLKHHHH